MAEPHKPKVDFGYQRVSPAEKTRRVEGVFSSVAARYDLMNDLMSFGSHRLMKRMLLEMSGLKPGAALLDVAGGTGDIAALGSAIVGSKGRVVLSDINAAMLALGRDALLDQGIANVSLCQADAEALPFPNDSFDCLTIGFGLRNLTDKDRALSEMGRVLRPGGVLLILEFSHIENPLLRTAYQGFQALWPRAGRLLVGDADAYKYLIESIRLHPKQRALKLMISDAGFANVEYHNLAGGAAAIHRAEVPLEAAL